MGKKADRQDSEDLTTIERERLEMREDAPVLAAPPDPVAFPARRDWTHVKNALNREVAALDKLADAAEGANRHSMARELRIDTAAIRERLLPEIAGQSQMNLVSHETSLGAVEQLIHDILHMAVEASPRPKLQDIERRAALRIHEFGERCYNRGWERGYGARRDDVDINISICADQARNEAIAREKGEQHGVGA